MCGFICICVDKWELVGIFSVPGCSQVFISKQVVTKYCLRCRNYWGGISVWCSYWYFSFIHVLLRAPVLIKKKRIFCWGFPEKSLGFSFFFFLNTFSLFKRTAKGLWDSLRETLTKKLSKNHGRFKSFHVILQRHLPPLRPSLLLGRFAITFSSQSDGKEICELLRLWIKLLVKGEIFRWLQRTKQG